MAATNEKNGAPRTPRINLNVPFKRCKYARALGAYWDAQHKVWYTYAGAHGAKRLVEFMSEQDKRVYID